MNYACFSLTATAILLLCCQASAQSSLTEGQERPALAYDEGDQVEFAAIGTALAGTEYSVTIPEGETASGLAVRAAEIAGVPVSVVRRLAGNRAVLAIDRDRLVIQLEQDLGAIGIEIERVEPFGILAANRLPQPRFRMDGIDELKGTQFGKSLQLALREDAQDLRASHYDAAEMAILEVIDIPIQLFDGDLPDTVIFFPANQILSARLETAVAATPGATAEPVAFVRPFHGAN